MFSPVLAVFLFFWPVTDSLLNESTHNHVIEFVERHLGAGKLPKDADRLVIAQKADGTWEDVDYQSKLRGAWKTSEHISRFSRLAFAYHASGDPKYLAAARKALSYWADTMPVCPNWWYNEIGCPREVGPAVILLMKDLDEEDIAGAVKILSKASFRQTGQNKIWQAEGVMMRAYLQGDSGLVRAARDTIASEISINPWKEGIQPDWSFHQHGPQLQWGNYGESYAYVMSLLTVLFDGTPLAFRPEQRSLIEDYVANGPAIPVWNGYYDMSACGRQITKGAQRSKAKGPKAAMKRLGMEEKDISGPRYYPYSDFAVYRGDGWYASVRMQSSRTKGMEHTNNENMRAYFAADGALLVRRGGDEYDDVSAVWNWRHVPGVTTYDDGSELLGWKVRDRYNMTDLVFGDVRDDMMAVAMDMSIDGMTGRKAWFFSSDCIVCLGCGITKEGDDRVVTAVEQCRIKGDITRKKKSVSHNGVTYIPVGCKFVMAPLEHSGSWKPIHPKYSDKMETMALLDVYIDHGKGPSGASYAYVIVPDGSSAEAALKRVSAGVKVLKNSTSVQSVSFDGKVVTIDWNAGKVVWD